MRAHQPERTCLGCGAKRPKRELLRIVRTPEGTIGLDPLARKPGRGAYVCRSASCVKKLWGGNRLRRSLAVSPPRDLQGELLAAVRSRDENEE